MGKSAFGSGLGGGFGSLSGSSKLGSFASSGTPGVIGGASKPLKPFGAPVDDEEEEGSGADEDDNNNTADAKPDADEKDERFFERSSTYTSVLIYFQKLPSNRI